MERLHYIMYTKPYKTVLMERLHYIMYTRPYKTVLMERLHYIMVRSATAIDLALHTISVCFYLEKGFDTTDYSKE